MVETRFEIVSRTVSEEMAKPYIPGTADCFFFGLRAADALNPTLDLAKHYAGSYRSLAGAQRALRKRGHTSLTQLFATHLEPCAPAMARIGDIAVIQLEDGEHVGVCVGQKFITKTDRGPSFCELSTIKAAFRAG